MTVLRALSDLYGKQVFYCTNIDVLLFGRNSLQLDNNRYYITKSPSYSDNSHRFNYYQVVLTIGLG